jgi:hypothetical protein
MAFVGPLTQDPSYHFFADGRLMYDVPNFWNVVSNFPFCIIGLLGVQAVTKSTSESWLGVGRVPIAIEINPDQPRPAESWLRFKSQPASCYVFFIGIFFTGIGSAYYHWNPNSATLVWDRLPMTIAFMGFFSLLIGDSISAKAGKQILLPLILIGLMSILYWKFKGDLRLYALVQFLPIILTPLILLFYKQQSGLTKYYWFMILFYGLAKVFEGYDKEIFSFSELSGHSIKHVFASLAPLTLCVGLRRKTGR